MTRDEFNAIGNFQDLFEVGLSLSLEATSHVYNNDDYCNSVEDQIDSDLTEIGWCDIRDWLNSLPEPIQDAFYELSDDYDEWKIITIDQLDAWKERIFYKLERGGYFSDDTDCNNAGHNLQTSYLISEMIDYDENESRIARVDKLEELVT